MQIIEMKLSDVLPYTRNQKKHDKKQIDNVAQSIKEFGYVQPIVIDKDNNIIIGHCRALASKKLKLDTVPCVKLEDLTPEEANKLRLLDNKLNESDWDIELLVEDIPQIDWTDFDIDWGIKFDEEEKEAVEDDFNAELPEEPKAKLGDIYKLGNHRLMCGDSTSTNDIDKLLNNQKIDMVYTDPPYGMNLDTDYSKMNSDSGAEFKKRKNVVGGKKYDSGKVDEFHPEMVNAVLSIKSDEVFMWGADYFAELLPNKNDGSWIVWDKRDDNENFDKMFGSQFELCWSKNKHKREIARIRWCGVFGTETEFDKKRFHPTQKPIKLSAWFIDKYSKENNNILDLFGGSGSTLIACEQLNRNCYMMELDPKYVDVIIARWEKFTGQKAELLNADKEVN